MTAGHVGSGTIATFDRLGRSRRLYCTRVFWNAAICQPGVRRTNTIVLIGPASLLSGAASRTAPPRDTTIATSGVTNRICVCGWYPLERVPRNGPYRCTPNRSGSLP